MATRKILRRFGMTSLAASLVGVAVSSHASADVYVISGSDPKNDTNYSGMEIWSRDTNARISFVCMSGRSRVTVRFQHNDFLTSSGEIFQLDYRIDTKPKTEHYFMANPDLRSGQFWIGYGHIYEDRYGPEPSDQASSNEHQAWRKKIEDQFVTDFAQGTTAVVRVFDYNDAPYDYCFDLTGVTKNLVALKPCY